MKTDRELLELAARGAGYDYRASGGYIVADGIPGNWNPLTDSRDALHLSVALKLDVMFFDGFEEVIVESGDVQVRCSEPYGDDLLFAARRAIVRAAAAIGEAMP